MAQQRLQKLLAQAGVASRRAAEELIREGRVRVNGRIVRELGTRADLHDDRVEVNGRRLVAEKPAYYLLHKPREMVTTLSDPEGRESLASVLSGVPERCFPVGRLDYHTSGALLLTNDGEMADALLHPTQGVPKAYIAKMKGVVAEQALQSLRNGVTLDDGYTTAKAEVFVVREDRGNSWLSITIREGKNRQIHRMGTAVGHRVMRLSRSSFAGLSVEGMRPGALRPLSSKELDKLKKDYLNPKRRRKANEKRRVVAEVNAEFFDGWGEEVLHEPAGGAPAPRGSARAGGRAAGASRDSGRRRTSGGGEGASTGSGRVNPTAQRAVRALEQKSAPSSRSIGGGRPAAKPATKKKPAAKQAEARKPVAKKPAAKRAAPRKPDGRQAPAKPGASRKPAAKKSAAKRAAPSRADGTQTPAKPGSGRKPAATKTGSSRKPAAKKSAAKRAPAQKSGTHASAGKKATGKGASRGAAGTKNSVRGDSKSRTQSTRNSGGAKPAARPKKAAKGSGRRGR